MRHHTMQLLILAAAASLALAGCGGSGNSSSVGGNAPAAVAPLDDGNAATPAGVVTLPVAINDQNQIVGSAEAAAGAPLKAAFWTVDAEGTATAVPSALTPLVADGFAAAFDLNNSGVIVGMAVNAAGSTRAVLWADQAAAPLTLPGLAGGTFAAAYGINDTGRIVGTAENGDGRLQPVRWQRAADGTVSGPFVLPGIPAGWEGEAYAVNGAQQVAGEMLDSAGNSQAVLWQWTPGTPEGSYARLDLPTPAGFDHAVAFALNEAGSVVGEASNDGVNGRSHAVRWSVNGSTVTVADLGGNRNSSAAAVSSDGRTVGWEANGQGTALATLWNPAGTPSAILTTDSQAFGINAGNLIVGRQGAAGFVKKVE